MALTDISNLTPEMKAAASPVLPIPNALPQGQDALSGDQTPAVAQPDNNPAFPLSPNTAGPGSTALSGALQSALSKPANGVPLTFNNKLSANVNANAEATPPELRNAPGMWARQLISGAQQALGTGLEDFANAKAPEGNHGILGGIAAVQQAKAERQQAAQKAQQAQQAFQTDQKYKQALIEKTNADTYHQQVLNHRESGDYSDKVNNEAIQTGKQAVAAATLNLVDAGQNPAQTIHSGITEAEKQNLLADQKWDPKKHTVWETDSKPVIDTETGEQKVDKDGSKQFEKLYTIIDTPEHIILDADGAAKLNKYLHTDFSKGQELPGALGLGNFQMAADAHALQSNRDAQLAKIDESAENEKQKIEMDKAQENLGTDFLQVVSGLPNITDQMKFVSGQHMIPDPTGKNPNGIVDPRSAKYAQTHPNAPNDLVNSYGGKAKFQALALNEAKEREKEVNDLRLEQEKTRQLQIEAKNEEDKKTADLNNHIDSFGNKSPLDDKEFNIRQNKYNASPQKKTLDTLSGTYDQFQNVLGDVAAGKITGPESIVALFDAVGISAEPLAGRGFRINNNVIQEHVGARGLDQAAIAKLDKLKNGQEITNDQIKEYAKIALQVYKSAYLRAANEQIRQLGYTDILPTGNGRLIDPTTASMYLQIAGGDPQRAAKAATAPVGGTPGWTVTPNSFSVQQGPIINPLTKQPYVKYAAGSGGHQLGWNGSAWVDAQTGTALPGAK